VSSLAIPEQARIWANSASALAVYLHVYQPFAAADGHEPFSDSTCPEPSDDGTTLTLTGDCTDADGTEWVGSATVVRSQSGDRSLTLDDFGTVSDGAPDIRRGSAELRRNADDDHDFTLDISHQAGVSVIVSYSGNVVGDYGTRSVWNGSGSVTREGLAAPAGTIEATTADEVIDDEVCSGQPASGTTVLVDERGETAVITYDGSSDCDEDATASYSFDGQPGAPLSGVVCAYAPPSGSGASAWQFAGVLGLAFLAAGRRAAAQFHDRKRARYDRRGDGEGHQNGWFPSSNARDAPVISRAASACSCPAALSLHASR
jgi:hypothetical protein